MNDWINEWMTSVTGISNICHIYMHWVKNELYVA